MTSAEPLVFAVDDDESSLRATARFLAAAGLEVRAYRSAEQLLAALPDDAWGCVVADLRMPGLSGLDLQGALLTAGCELPVVFLTGYADIPSSVQAIRGGAEDFIEKSAPPAALLDAVLRAIDRDSVNRSLRLRHQAVAQRLAALTAREREVLQHVVRGRLNKQIAGDLGIHERTVKLHRTAITEKLGVHSVAELTSLCHEAGLLDPPEESYPKG